MLRKHITYCHNRKIDDEAAARRAVWLAQFIENVFLKKNITLVGKIGPEAWFLLYSLRHSSFPSLSSVRPPLSVLYLPCRLWHWPLTPSLPKQNSKRWLSLLLLQKGQMEAGKLTDSQHRLAAFSFLTGKTQRYLLYLGNSDRLHRCRGFGNIQISLNWMNKLIIKKKDD